MTRKILILALANLLSAATPAFAGGWYLKAPPRNGAVVDTNAPLSRWQVWASYDQSSECESWNQKDRDTAFSELKNP